MRSPCHSGRSQLCYLHPHPSSFLLVLKQWFFKESTLPGVDLVVHHIRMCLQTLQGSEMMMALLHPQSVLRLEGGPQLSPVLSFRGLVPRTLIVQDCVLLWTALFSRGSLQPLLSQAGGGNLAPGLLPPHSSPVACASLRGGLVVCRMTVLHWSLADWDSWGECMSVRGELQKTPGEGSAQGSCQCVLMSPGDRHSKVL